MRVLPEPDSPTRPTISPGWIVSPASRTPSDLAMRSVELDAQASMLSSGADVTVTVPPRAGRPSDSPSPSSPAPTPNRTTTSPGRVAIHQALSSVLWPSAMIDPSSAFGGWAPRPR